MKALVDFLARGLASQPDAVHVNEVNGEASVLLELSVAPEDLAAIQGEDGETLRAIRAVLSAAAGQRKAVLELIEPTESAAE